MEGGLIRSTLRYNFCQYYQGPIKKGAGNFNAGCDEALSRFLWGCGRGNDVTYPNKASFGASCVSKLTLFEYVISSTTPHKNLDGLLVYCLLYKQVQSATAIITDTPLSDTAKRPVTSSEIY